MPPVVAQDIRDLRRWTGHGRRRLRRRLVFPVLSGLLARLRQQIERALDAGDHAGGDPRIPCRCVQLVMPQERLNDPDVAAALKQMGREAVAQRVQGNALLDRGFIRRLMEQAGWSSACPAAGRETASVLEPASCCRKQPALSTIAAIDRASPATASHYDPCGPWIARCG